MSSCVLDKPSLVTEPVVAVLPHAVEMRLMFSVVAVSKLTVLIEPTYKESCEIKDRSLELLLCD